MTTIESHAVTALGRRDNNEDSVLTNPGIGIFAVADGMGGHAGGEVASQLAMTTIFEVMQRASPEPEAQIIRAIRSAHDRIRIMQQQRSLWGMGTTIAVLRIVSGRSFIAHVGDSRVYRLRRGELQQLTVDHAFGRSVLSRALGADNATPDLRTGTALPGDTFLLCTDGLYEKLPQTMILKLLRDSPQSMAAKVAALSPAAFTCQMLVAAALEAGGGDNVSVIVVRVL